MKKEDIRAQVRARKTMLDAYERTEAARRVFDSLTSLASFTVAERVLIYNSLPDELPTREFIDRFDLDILPYERTRTHLGAFRIEEPDGEDTTDVADIDLIIVPAVAYDRRGNRVGRGKGFYDRLLSRARALKIGVGYGFQLIEDGIDADPHDVPVDIVITDGHGIIKVRR